jgi:serine/threonine-protein kinase
MSFPLLPPGTVLSGRYQLTEIIGESELATVYGALDLRSEAPLAVKVFAAQMGAQAAELSEYQALARQASALGVEGIARAYDFGIDANSGLAFSTAERVSWPSLDRRVLAQGPIAAADLSRALAVLARALDAAHGAGLVHRDLKPQNVFISTDHAEWVRITDFGIRALRRHAPGSMGWGGPPGYTAPEAVDASAPATPSMDLFSLGLVTLFALTRATPFRSLRNPGFDPHAHWAELNQPVPSISERMQEIGVTLDPAFDAWFRRALALMPHERFSSGSEMAREFASVAEQVGARGGGGPRPMPGIAAAIAQPLVFQPEPAPRAPSLSNTLPAAPAAIAAAAALPQTTSLPPPVASTAEAPPSLRELSPAGLPRSSSKLPLLLALGVLLAVGGAFGAVRLFSNESDQSAGAASASASAAPLASAAPAMATARFTCEPGACDWVMCNGTKLEPASAEHRLAPGAHECSASKYGYGPKSLKFELQPQQVATLTFELEPLPERPPQVAGSSVAVPAPRIRPPAAPSKPVVAPKATGESKTRQTTSAAGKTGSSSSKSPPKTSTKSSASSKKKCSTFLGCK